MFNAFILLLIVSHSFFVVYAWYTRKELIETQIQLYKNNLELNKYVDYIGDEFEEYQREGTA